MDGTGVTHRDELFVISAIQITPIQKALLDKSHRKNTVIRLPVKVVVYTGAVLHEVA
jgi:hypothetical protein